MRKQSIVALKVLIFMVSALTIVAVAADPNVGTWKLNLAKSKFAGPPPKNGMVIITAQDNGIKSVSDSVNGEGKATHIEFAAKYDGKDYPVTGSTTYDTMALTRVDANTTDLVPKKDGKEIGRGRAVVSEDGKTRTVTGKGQDTSFTAVYDKQ